MIDMHENTYPFDSTEVIMLSSIFLLKISKKKTLFKKK